MEVYRVLKSTGTLWLNIGDSYWGGNRKHEHIKAKDLIGIPWMIAFALRDAGWYLRDDIIWNKPNAMPESVRDRCTSAHEHIFLLTKSAKYYFDHEAIQEDAVSFSDMQRRVKNGFKEWKTKKANSTYSIHNSKSGGRSREELYNKNGKRNKRNVWTVNTQSYPEAHFATYPPELIVPCIKAGCPENGIVLDPFMGSGTTAVVARKLNRNFIGIELNPAYIKIAEKRLNDELGMWL
jgi:DNA modification methylase